MINLTPADMIEIAKFDGDVRGNILLYNGVANIKHWVLSAHSVDDSVEDIKHFYTHYLPLESEVK